MTMLSEYLEMCGTPKTRLRVHVTKIEEPTDEIAPLDLVVASLNVPDQTALLQ